MRLTFKVRQSWAAAKFNFGLLYNLMNVYTKIKSGDIHIGINGYVHFISNFVLVFNFSVNWLKVTFILIVYLLGCKPYVITVERYRFMPGPCSAFQSVNNFGNRFYPKEKKPGCALLFWIYINYRSCEQILTTTGTRHKQNKTNLSVIYPWSDPLAVLC